MPPRQAARLFSSVTRPSRALSASVGRRFPYSATTLQPTTCRFAHSIPKPPSSTAQSPSAPSSSAAEGKPRKLLEPHYMLTFTCVPCGDRSQHYISKQGYHRGSVLITCPSCRNRHIISDNLNIFGNKKITVEDLMREKGQLVKRGSLGEDGDVEFWEDGTMTEHNPITGRKLPTEALAEEDVGDQEAKKMRDARDPSAQAAEVTPTAAHAPLSTAGARPSVDSTTQPHAVPSTRRQFSTTRYLKESPEQDLGVPREVS
ncbi:DNL zinc finger-domain-containing protein [Xylariomycetidae sp. FL0641]|nr:DNL zinc finger-domain-containing protein [Xylariomycetidae sp. FL0641]